MLLLSLALNGTRGSSKKSFHCLTCLLKSFALGSQPYTRVETGDLDQGFWLQLCNTKTRLCLLIRCRILYGFCVSFFSPTEKLHFQPIPSFFFCHSKRSDGTQHTFRKHLLVVHSWDKQYVTLHKKFGTDIYL